MGRVCANNLYSRRRDFEGDGAMSYDRTIDRKDLFGVGFVDGANHCRHNLMLLCAFASLRHVLGFFLLVPGQTQHSFNNVIHLGQDLIFKVRAISYERVHRGNSSNRPIKILE